MSGVRAVAVPATKRHVFADLSVRVKILTAIGVAAAVALVVGLVTLFALDKAANSAQAIYANNVTNVGQVDEIQAGFATIQRVIERGQSQGIFRADLDPRLASWIFYGGLEEILTGWVLGQLPDGDEEVARAERTVVALLRGGLTRDGAAAPV